jgi:nucleoside recognition membrane protein YjiH
MQTGYHGTTLTPFGDCLLGVYFEIFLKYLEQSFKNKSWKILNFHHTTMLWFTLKNYGKYVIFKKIEIHLQVILLLKTLVIMFSKCFWAYVIHYIDFKLFNYIYQYIENNIM